MKRRSNSTKVWSSDGGRLCASCSKPKTECECWAKQSQKIDRSGDGIVRVSRETKGRKGKGVTLISGLQMTEKEMKVLAKELKKKCGTGGTVANGKIEIQGEQRDRLVELLSKKGYKVKRVGG
ncbi:MAG: translation initiation factor Sui1 [Chloroflexota bacterium]